MTPGDDNVQRFPSRRPPASSGSGNGGSGHGERLARIETELKHVATREDVEAIKTLIERKEATMLRWLLGLVGVAAITLVAAVIRTFL